MSAAHRNTTLWGKGMNFGEPSERKKSGDLQARLAKGGGLNLRVGFEPRRLRWAQSGNKPACFECGNDDRFKAQCPISMAKTERWANPNQSPTAQGGIQNGKKGRAEEKGQGVPAKFHSLGRMQATME